MVGDESTLSRADDTNSTSVKKEFLAKYEGDSRYNKSIEEKRNQEFGRIKGTYLDNVGATLYSKSQLDKHMQDLNTFVYGNPHSDNANSQMSVDLIHEARKIVAKHFNTTLDKHHVIFTSGATGALKMVAENFSWSVESLYVFLEDNHTSVIGIKESAKAAGAHTICMTEASFSEYIHADKGQRHVQPFYYSPVEAVPSDDSRCNISHSTGKTFQNSAYVHSNTRKWNFLNDQKPSSLKHCKNTSRKVKHLFSYPAMSNFCGRKYPAAWCDAVRDGCLANLHSFPGKWYVVLDAASYVSSSSLDLSAVDADFVTISFYKIFGFPTGIGALIVKADAIGAFKERCYFGGGTVASAVNSLDYQVLKDGVPDRYEDGTVSFLSIIALKHGFETLKSLTLSMQAVSNHTFALAQYTYKAMKSLRHANGQNLCILYCDTDYSDVDKQGPVINFNLKHFDGTAIGYSQVAQLANLSDIYLRTGCFCNIGDCQKHLQLSPEEALSQYRAGHVCGDQMDIINGKPTGSVRISFGYMSILSDAMIFLKFLIDNFLVVNQFMNEREQVPVDDDNQSHARPNSRDLEIRAADDFSRIFSKKDGTQARLKEINLYPVKSCSSFNVSSWPVGEKGLLYDREWMIITDDNTILTQKKDHRLIYIKPDIDLKSKTLNLKCEGYEDISVAIRNGEEYPVSSSKKGNCATKLCGDRVFYNDCGDLVAKWLTEVLNRKCRLARQNDDSPRLTKKNYTTNFRTSLNYLNPSEQLPLSFANESQYLLLSVQSMASLIQTVFSDSEKEGTSDSFRGNFIIDGSLAFEEDNWSYVKIGDILFKVSGRCRRCQMICIDQKTGRKRKEMLANLIKLRGSKMEFGVYLISNTDSYNTYISVGDSVEPTTITTEQV